MLNTTNWKTYPFSVDGVNFVSKINPKGSMYSQIKNVPPALFDNWNISAIRQMIGSVSEMSKSDIQAELDRVNEGATQALICLE